MARLNGLMRLCMSVDMADPLFASPRKEGQVAPSATPSRALVDEPAWQD